MSSALETLRRDFGGGIIERVERSTNRLVARYWLRAIRPTSCGPEASGTCKQVSDSRPVQGLCCPCEAAATALGFGTNDGGVVIDLSRLAEVEIIDSERHLVRIGGGATWGQVAAVLAPHGLAISSGDTKSVGVGGLTLAGGIGWQVRKYGLTHDSVAATVTASDRSCARARMRTRAVLGDPRGGGTRDRDRLDHGAPDHRRLHGTIAFPAPQAATVLQGCRTTCAPPPKSSRPPRSSPIHSRRPRSPGRDPCRLRQR
jgi:hypothetical protein